mgnify:CR=1 FL=1
MLKIIDLFDLSHSAAGEWLKGITWPWEALEGITDTILRLGRDPLRKLGPGDRLVGAAVNALAQGVTPVHLVTGIAAGLRFAHAGDPVAQALQARIATEGIEQVASEVTGFDATSPLLAQVIARYAALG